MKNKILPFLLGTSLGILSVFLFQCYNKFLIVSTDQDVLDLSINVLSSLIAAILSTAVAFLVASFQIEKERDNISFQMKIEKDNIKKENYTSNIRYLNVLKHECETNLFNVNSAIKNSTSIDPKTLLLTLSNIFSMDSWDVLYLKIEVNKECYEAISKLYREFRKIKGTFATEFEVIQLNNLCIPLTNAISLIETEITTLEVKINDLKLEDK